MMFDVMIEVAVPCMSEQRLKKVRKGRIEPFPLLRQDAVVVDVIMHHEGERSHTPARVKQMYHAMEVGEVVEEVNGARKSDAEIP